MIADHSFPCLPAPVGAIIWSSARDGPPKGSKVEHATQAEPSEEDRGRGRSQGRGVGVRGGVRVKARARVGFRVRDGVGIRKGVGVRI